MIETPRKTILLIDDDDDWLQVLAARCQALGLEPHTARNPLTALRKCEELPLDLICMDVNMPCGNGLSLCEFLLSQPGGPTCPIIVLTGCTDGETQRRCENMRATYVHKRPSAWDELRETILNLIDLYGAPREVALGGQAST